jgi:hypothetical protein
MIAALLAAATVAATPSVTQTFPHSEVGGAPPSAIVPPGGVVERTPNLYHQPANCRSVVAGELARQQVAFKGHPPAAQYAVLRKLDGCSVPTPVGYHPNYLLDGAADAPAAKRGDAPSNRR